MRPGSKEPGRFASGNDGFKNYKPAFGPLRGKAVAFADCRRFVEMNAPRAFPWVEDERPAWFAFDGLCGIHICNHPKLFWRWEHCDMLIRTPTGATSMLRLIDSTGFPLPPRMTD